MTCENNERSREQLAFTGGVGGMTRKGEGWMDGWMRVGGAGVTALVS